VATHSFFRMPLSPYLVCLWRYNDDGGGRLRVSPCPHAAILADRHAAFEVFRRSYRRSEVLEEGKREMQQKMAEARTCGQGLERLRSQISLSQGGSLARIWETEVGHGGGGGGW